MGIDHIPSNDFSFYDHMLDTVIMLSAIPQRFKAENLTGMHLYFAMARGTQLKDGSIIPAMEMTKWFNTNYHYIVPEIDPGMQFSLNPEKLLEAFKLAQSLDLTTRPVLVGPVSFLLLSKSTTEDFSPLEKLDDLLKLYAELFAQLKASGIEWLQLDEPFLCTDLDETQTAAYQKMFEFFGKPADRPKVMLTAYFGDLSENSSLAAQSPFEGLHIDMTNCSDADALLSAMREEQTLSLGLINGRNIWKNDLTTSLDTVKNIQGKYNFAETILAPSCSMLHVPQDLSLEKNLPADVNNWLAFARQKLEELMELKNAVNNNFQPTQFFAENQAAIKDRRERVKASAARNKAAKERGNFQRQSPFAERKAKQAAVFNLPILPTTTIGSFPQTSDVRKLRSRLRKGAITPEEYKNSLKEEIEKTIRFQEETGLDVLVHGEFERNDMVQYFAEKLGGFTFTSDGWVQSYGSRCVRPPVIYADVTRPEPMTVEWSTYAQSLTDKPVKGMLTGPVTILKWSFVRDDQPLAETCRQIAFAIRLEVLDLEKAGIGIIQIDEPALREGLPLQRKYWAEYLDWAVECFHITYSGVQDETQIHTHMCYSEFNDIIHAIAAMDADVISIEASRSKMELLEAFEKFNYPNDIGPGVYDIHSPNVPGVEEIEDLIRKALEVIPLEQLWVNPDCGLKTRRWEEVTPSLKNLVSAVLNMREELKK
jgi:5-methyltetrahydropteroyltriglutamate--homocysteine methyltransferase